MGHDIYGYNQARKEVAYARFSMSNGNASILYNLLDANKFNAGVSGSGSSTTFTKQQIEKAMYDYNQFFGHHAPLSDRQWDQKQILEFIQNCLATAQKEGSVKVYFG